MLRIVELDNREKPVRMVSGFVNNARESKRFGPRQGRFNVKRHYHSVTPAAMAGNLGIVNLKAVRC